MFVCLQPLSACRVVEPFRLVKVVTVIHHPTGLRESNVSSLEQEVLKAFQRGYNGITRNGVLSEEILFRQYFVFDNFITFELKNVFDRTRQVTYTSEMSGASITVVGQTFLDLVDLMTFANIFVMLLLGDARG